MKKSIPVGTVVCMFFLLTSCGLFMSFLYENLPVRFEESFPVSRTGDDTWYPRLVWAGDKWCILYLNTFDDLYHLYYSYIHIDDSDLSHTISPENPGFLAEDVDSLGFDVVWNGKELGIIINKYVNGVYNLFFCRVDSDGLVISDSEKQITDSTDHSRYPSITWNNEDRQYGICWEDEVGTTTPSDIRFVILDEYGTKISEPYTLVNARKMISASRIIWNGEDYVFSWMENLSNGMCSIFFKSGINGDEVHFSGSESYLYKVGLAFSGDEYGLVWNEEGGQVNFTRLDLGGNISGEIESIGYSEGLPKYPCIVWDGVEYGIAWQENSEGIDRIHFSYTLNHVPSDTTSTCFMTTTGNSSMPSLAWNGAYYAVAWMHEEGEESHRIYFAF